jgi:molybdate transport system ATP-binding protein
MVGNNMSQLGLEARLFLRLSATFRLDLELAIPPGRTAALLGPNAAGKSTAVAAIAGLRPLDAGQIMLDGRTLDEPASDRFVPPEARRIGVVFQDYLLFPHMTVYENVAFGLRAQGVPRKELTDRIDHYLARVGLADLKDRKPAELSGGQSQRVALARALVIEPDLLLLDEPLSALDVTTRAHLRRSLAQHLEEFDGPRLLITHDPTEAFLMADEIHVMEDGAISQTGTADDLRLRPRTSYAADLAGANLIVGTAEQGVITSDGHRLHIADSQLAGPVLATIAPTAISLHQRRPEGSPRNSWQTQVGLIEPLGERVRLRLAAPLPLTVEITLQAAGELNLAAGGSVWVSIKATEIGVEPDR